MSRICYFLITSLKISLVVKNVSWYPCKSNNYALVKRSQLTNCVHS